MGDGPISSGSGNSPVFIIGCIRSGTTLLSELLNAHPDLAIFCESFLFRSSFLLRREWLKLDLSDEGHAVAFLSFLFEEYNPYGHGQQPVLTFLDSQALRTVMLQSDRSPRTWLGILFDAWAKQQGGRRWGDKSTPQQAGEILEMHRLFPDARFVHIHRDPRGVAHSIVGAGWAPDVDAGAVVWRMSMKAIRSGLAAVPSDQVHEISYRSLCSTPEPVLRDVCSFLGEQFSPLMLELPRRPNPTLANISLAPLTANTSAPILEANFNTWRSRLTRAQVHSVESLTCRLMSQYGYQPDQGSTEPGIMERIRTVRLMRNRRRFIQERHRTLLAHLTRTFHPT